MFTISKWGLSYAEPIFFVAVRMILAGLILCSYMIIRNRGIKSLVAGLVQDWQLFLQIIFFHIYLTYVCDIYALTSISSIESSFMYNLSPFVAALFSYFWFGEYMTHKKWFGLLLGMSSLIPEYVAAQPIDISAHIWPRLLTLCAVVSSAYGWIVVRALVKKGHSAIFINGIGMFFGGLLALLTSSFTETWRVTSLVPFIQAVVLVVLVANIIFYNFYGYLLKFYTATFLSVAGFLCPFFTAILGRIFLGETFSWGLVISFLVTCIGLTIFYSEELKQGYVLQK